MASEKVAFITGGNKGIGLETARQLGKLGIKVVIGARDLAKGNEAIAKLKADGVTAETVKFDITKAADYKEVYKYLDQHFGKLDILVNNAGISKEDFLAGNKTSNTSAELLHETFDTNFFGAVELTQVLLPLIKKAPAGRIVNLSSILGSISLHADPKSPIYDAKAFAYDASKSALNAFTVHLAHELKDTKIKVNSAHPGWVKTDMGGEQAPLDIVTGAKTSVKLATLPDDGPTGAYIHLDQTLPW
jgi:NAD(P)-dependent dehydrogenase (short-subunit alcohol dehydrogenase family)